MIKKVIIVSILIVVNIIFFVINASAETYENLTYVATDGEITITGCNIDAIDVVIPDKINGYSVTCIEKFAFQGCTELENITIPASMKIIGDCAFLNCHRLRNVYINDMANWCNIDFYIMASNPLTYAENLYLNGELVEVLELPKGLTEIRSFAFVDYDKLKSVIIPSGVKRIGEATFNCCDGLISVHIPDGVESIGNSAFLGCTRLKSIVLPNSITDVSIAAFKKCSSLTNVVLSNNITSIPMHMFGECASLTDITIPAGVENIDRCAFEDCTNLINVTIPHTLTSIYYGAFSNCSNLTTVLYDGTEADWKSIVIGTNNSSLVDADIVYVVRTNTIVSEDGKIFTIMPINVKNGQSVILALYDRNNFVEIQHAIYEGEPLPLIATKEYTKAKIMVWESLKSMKPLCGAEIIPQSEWITE